MVCTFSFTLSYLIFTKPMLVGKAIIIVSFNFFQRKLKFQESK